LIHSYISFKMKSLFRAELYVVKGVWEAASIG